MILMIVRDKSRGNTLHDGRTGEDWTVKCLTIYGEYRCQNCNEFLLQRQFHEFLWAVEG